MAPSAVCWPVRAMARPRRAPGEADLVREAERELRLTGSRRARAQRLARRCAEMAIALIAADDFELALVRVDAVLNSPALAKLVLADDSTVGAMLLEIAQARFLARGCRHAAPGEVPGINRAIADELALKLAERFRKILG